MNSFVGLHKYFSQTYLSRASYTHITYDTCILDLRKKFYDFSNKLACAYKV